MRRLVSHITFQTRWFFALALLVLCLAPTFISYGPYKFHWDDSVYLHQAINLSRAFWSGAHGINHLHDIRRAMYGYGERPPAMSLLGLPWGPLTSWDAVGDCFFTLACSIALLASTCLFMLTRIGAAPLPIALASVCIGGALGPWMGSQVNQNATSFMADTLFAWISLAALLLIPYEAKTGEHSTPHTLIRGILSGIILSAGAMTKISFLYLDVLILPCLLLIRLRRHGLRNSATAFAGFLIGSAPSLFYLAKYGRSSLQYARASSFGGVSSLYGNSLSAFLQRTLNGSPTLWLFIFFALSALALTLFKRRNQLPSSASVAILIAIGFELVVLSSPNRDIRFSFPLIISLPFLFAILLSPAEKRLPRRGSLFVAAIAFAALCLAAWPARHRAKRMDSLGRADAVLSLAFQCGSNNILMATNGATLNDSLLQVALDTSDHPPTIHIGQLNWSALHAVPIAEDYRAIRDADMVVLQEPVVSATFFNTRANKYRQYINEQKDYTQHALWSDVTGYCRNSAR